MLLIFIEKLCIFNKTLYIKYLVNVNGIDWISTMNPVTNHRFHNM